MQKCWYILYTKSGTEKKVVASLTKRKIENYLPICSKIKNSAMTNKVIKIPLFTGYVFVFATSSELLFAQQIRGVINLVYWKGKPVIVSSLDIQNMKDFSSCHEWIRLVPIEVNRNEKSKPIDPPFFIVNETLIATKRHPLGVSVPSIGFILVAEGKEEKERMSIFNGKSKERVF